MLLQKHPGAFTPEYIPFLIFIRSFQWKFTCLRFIQKKKFSRFKIGTFLYSIKSSASYFIQRMTEPDLNAILCIEYIMYICIWHSHKCVHRSIYTNRLLNNTSKCIVKCVWKHVYVLFKVNLSNDISIRVEKLFWSLFSVNINNIKVRIWWWV